MHDEVAFSDLSVDEKDKHDEQYSARSLHPHYVGVGLRYVRADQCLLFRVERCPLFGGSKCISSMGKSIGGK